MGGLESVSLEQAYKYKEQRFGSAAVASSTISLEFLHLRVYLAVITIVWAAPSCAGAFYLQQLVSKLEEVCSAVERICRRCVVISFA